MCGRFAQAASLYYAGVLGVADYPVSTERYNVTPGSDILAYHLSAEEQPALGLFRWGLVPAWSKAIDPRYRMINARAETIHQKPAYRQAFRRHRCIVPAMGFYEWQTTDKQPYFIRHPDHQPLYMAAIWDRWQSEEQEIQSCAIVTCAANHAMASIHHRMPVLLQQTQFDEWLGSRDIDKLQPLMQPWPLDDLDIYPVSRAVNHARQDSPQLIEPYSSKSSN